MLTHQGWFNLLIHPTFTPTTNYRVCNLHIYLYPTQRRHITSPSEKSRPEMGKATPVWQLTISRAATKCNMGRLANNPVSGKACSPTKGGLICLYMQPLLLPQTTEFVICISIYIRLHAVTIAIRHILIFKSVF